MLNSSSSVFLDAAPAGSTSRPVTSVTVHPVALFSILDHFLRRTSKEDRVIGTLLGARVDNVIEIKDSFAVPHNETDERVELDSDYHKTMADLRSKVNPREVIVGWYSTGSDLNTYSALLQNFYSQETAPYQAVHLVLDTGVQQGGQLGVKAFVSLPLGVSPKPENAVFVPIPCDLRFHETERPGLDLLLSSASSSAPVSPSTDLTIMENTLSSVIEMIDRVLTYVRSVVSGEVEGNERIGKYLLDALTETNVSEGVGLEKGVMEGQFNEHLQDTLMVSYLANLVRSQVEISSRLALVT